jgi:hypothetical protein
VKGEAAAMRFLRRKSGTERLLETVMDSLAAVGGSLTRGKALKAGLIAGGVAGLTAGSAGISSLRRRLEGTRDG